MLHSGHAIYLFHTTEDRDTFVASANGPLNLI